MASAAFDRLLHGWTVVNIRGESYRLKEKRAATKGTGVDQEFGSDRCQYLNKPGSFFMAKGGQK